MDSSESAVLEVTLDHNTDDSSTGSLDTNSITQAFQDMDNCPDLIMEPGEDIVVQVDAPVKQMSTMETYVTFRVRCKCARWSTPTHVRRRYNQFKAFHTRLSASYPLTPIPPLPHTHSAREQLDRYAASFVSVRTLALDAFLKSVALHPLLSLSEELQWFVCLNDEELEKTLRPKSDANAPHGTGFGLFGLASFLGGFGSTSSADKPARVKDPEFSSASDYLNSLQLKLKSLHALTIKLFKDQQSVSKEMIEIKRSTDAWSSSERGANSSAVCAVGHAFARSGHMLKSAGSTTNSDLRGFKALIPYRARYAAAVCDKISQRDQLHAEYVASNNSSEIHNRLEQASEALRSELGDWKSKNRAEIKAILLDIAERQLTIHRNSLAAWDEAVRWCKSGNRAEGIFETCTETAVANSSLPKSSHNQEVTVEINTTSQRKTSLDYGQPNSKNESLNNSDENLFKNGSTSDEDEQNEITSDSFLKNESQKNADEKVSNLEDTKVVSESPKDEITNESKTESSDEKEVKDDGFSDIALNSDPLTDPNYFSKN